MKLLLSGVVLLLACVTASPARAADQAVPGAANALAVNVADRSPLVRQSLQYLRDQAQAIRDPALRRETLDATTNDDTCIRHRAGLSAAAKQAILDRLLAEGLYAAADAASFPGGALAGVFPPVLDDGGACPRLPQPFRSAPGSSFRGHHSMPGGLPIHEAFNEKSDVSLAENYARNYRVPGFPSGGGDDHPAHGPAFPGLNEDVILAAPLWHDWAKSIVFQWNADGSEFREFNFGGDGQSDAFGAAGDSRTGGHHIMSVAESMARRLAPDMVIAQASAHSTPTNGNEYKVVNWLRAAASMARIDPVAAGYLHRDAAGDLRLPPLRHVGDVNLETAAPPQLNFLPEYVIHNLSDADFILTGPVVTESETILAALAARYGYDPADVTRYNWSYRNVALAQLSAERIAFVYQRGGLAAVQAELDVLHARGVI
jgi:hypothetical protein